jgi:radical SAM superfamily enzyme YgiQ (UPF0313 family)
LLEGRKFILRDIEVLGEEMEQVYKKFGIDYLFFVDNEFNVPAEYAEKVCDEILKRKLKFNWTCFVNPVELPLELLKKMKLAGCDGVELGIDSASDKTLEGLKKGFYVEHIEKAVENIKKVDLPLCLHLLLGGPNEDENTVKETFNRVEKFNPTITYIHCGIRVYPATQIEKEYYETYGIKPNESLLEPKFYFSPNIEKERLFLIVREFASKHKNYLVPGLKLNITEGACRSAIYLRSRGIRGPLWNYTWEHKNTSFKNIRRRKT